MLLTTETQYHLSCSSCGKDWWDIEPFRQYCPYCKTNRVPDIKEKIEAYKHENSDGERRNDD